MIKYSEQVMKHGTFRCQWVSKRFKGGHDPMLRKINLIYFPFLIIWISFTVIYNLLFFLIFIKLKLFSINKEFLYIELPFIFLFLVVFVWLRPRIKLLKLTSKIAFVYLGSAVLAITLPNMPILKYITKASGELTKLTNMSNIDEHEKTQYYSVENYFVTKSDFTDHVSSEKWGRHNKRLLITLFIALPIYDSIVDKSQHVNPYAWLGLKYDMEMKNNLSEAEKETIIHEFIVKSGKIFDARNVQKFTYLERIGNSNDLKGFIKAIERNPQFNSINNIVLIPIDTPFEDRNKDAIRMIFSVSMIGAFLWFVILLFPKFDEERLRVFLDKSKPVINLK